MNGKDGRRWTSALAVIGAALALVAAACSSKGATGGPTPGNTSTAAQPPTANLKPPTSIGPGEGQLNLIAWEGYAQPEWVKPFERQTGCVVHAKYAGSSDEMVALMRQGGGQYDLVSASGDARKRRRPRASLTSAV